jgi:phosphopantetheine--protein transferase-like protein
MERIIRCGIDIEEPDRFSRHLASWDGTSGFLDMIFTAEEISRNGARRPHLTFPLAFSCKEAVFKALGRSWTNSKVSWKDIEVIFNREDDLADHEVRLRGAAKEMFDELGCGRIESSLEVHPGFVIAEVLFISG